ncbi:MAG: hypothetical protein A2350_00550 [Candidatus Raymondbacteria bacterium RifOxyB12_full_50_8]|nr:MAG: hypothetical protein A2350_00550 [Candidatus Raymondbacteria bacterium RifOxyB12_full_50_8]
MDVSQYVGIILIDGMSGAEERVMDRIGNLTDISFIGGSAGDDLQFKKTFVSSGGKAYSGAAVLALLKPVNGFDFLKTQSFSSTGKKLKATDVDETARTVHAFDGKPAMQAYAQVLGVSLADAGQKFMTNPVGLKVGEEFYVRSPQQPQGQSLRFYCNIKKGMELDVLVSRDIVQDTRIALDAKKKELGLIRGIIDFHCILRTLELRQKNQCDAYGKLFEGIPAIGFSTYGEEFIGHINQTSTMLIFK